MDLKCLSKDSVNARLGQKITEKYRDPFSCYDKRPFYLICVKLSIKHFSVKNLYFTDKHHKKRPIREVRQTALKIKSIFWFSRDDFFATQFSLMSAVRECVNGRDLDRFDVLVLRREVEVLKNRHQTPDCSSATQDNKESCGSESSLSAAESLCLSPEAHSTPNDSYKSPDKQPTPPSAAGRSATVSPVRPTTKPPPPPSKTPPVKPKRSTTVGSQSVRTPPSGFTVPAGGQQDTPSEHENVLFAACDENSEERSSSPFTLALEKHRSSHSGRIKVGPKVPTHQRIPSKDFFSPPDSRDGSTRSSSTTRRSLIEPVRDLSLRVKALPKKPTASFNSGRYF